MKYSVYMISMAEGDYVGASSQPFGRMNNHVKRYLSGDHVNKKIRESKTPVTDWTFQLLEVDISEKDIADREAYWIEETCASLNIRSKAGIRLNRDQEIVTMVNKGYTYREVAKYLGVAVGTVGNAIRRINKQ